MLPFISNACQAFALPFSIYIFCSFAFFYRYERVFYRLVGPFIGLARLRAGSTTRAEKKDPFLFISDANWTGAEERLGDDSQALRFAPL